MPEAEEFEIEIHDKDIRVDTFCSSGAGGQSVNTTKSAVRVTHVPTGIVATCQDGKSQNSNKEKALQVLRARISDLKRHKRKLNIPASGRARSAQVTAVSVSVRTTSRRAGLPITGSDLRCTVWNK